MSMPVSAAVSGYSPGFEVDAQAVYLYNLDTGTLIYEKDSDKRVYPASLTKIMTAILALENTPDLDNTLVAYPTYVQDYLYNYQQQVGKVSLGGMMAGEELSMRQLLYAIMLPSANEAAMTIADHIGGSQEAFAEMMNKRAKELGAGGTNFVNPNGLFAEEHYTTAYDMAQITMHAMELPGFMDIASTLSYESGQTNKHDNLVWNTTNQMMIPNNSYYYPYLKGIKTGTLPESGYNFISTATRDGFTYLLVVIGGAFFDASGGQLPNNTAFEVTAKLYDWVFDTFRQKALVEKGKYVAEVPLRLSLDKDYLQLMTGDRFTALIPGDIEVTSVALMPVLPDSIDAPVEKGTQIGEVRLILAGEEMGRVPLLAAESVAASPMMILLERAKEIMRSFWFKFAVSFLILLVLLYIVLMIIRNRNRRRYGGYRPRRRL